MRVSLSLEARHELVFASYESPRCPILPIEGCLTWCSIAIFIHYLSFIHYLISSGSLDRATPSASVFSPCTAVVDRALSLKPYAPILLTSLFSTTVSLSLSTLIELKKKLETCSGSREYFSWPYN
jgi:hypothetical protein